MIKTTGRFLEFNFNMSSYIAASEVIVSVVEKIGRLTLIIRTPDTLDDLSALNNNKKQSTLSRFHVHLL